MQQRACWFCALLDRQTLYCEPNDAAELNFGMGVAASQQMMPCFILVNDVI